MRRRILGCLVVLLVGLVMNGCGPIVQTLDRVKFTPPPEAVSQGGLSLEVTTLGFGEMAEADELSIPLSSSLKWPMMDAPAFRVKVINNNQHIVRLTGSVIKLADKDKVLFDVLSKGQLKTNNVRAFEKWSAQNRPGVKESNTEDVAAIEDRIDSIKILDQSAEILPGFSGTYYLAFDLPTKSMKTEPEYNAWVIRHAPFSLMLFDVITATDQAGNVSRKSRFEFPIRAGRVRETYQNGNLVKSEEVK